ncbi:MAG: tetratricopeptide repeat protein [Candidatus Omnitrophota bacterium]
MYYSYAHKLLNRIQRLCGVFLLISVAFTYSPKTVHSAENVKREGEQYRVEGYEAQQRGDFQRALNLYAKAISMGVETAGIYNDLGVLYEQMGFLPRAEESYLQALKVDPEYLPPYTNLAYLYKSRGETDKAIVYFQKRLDRADENDPWTGPVMDELLALDPNYRNRMVQTEMAEATEEIARKKQDQLMLDVNRAEHHIQAGEQFLEDDDFKQAMREFDRALSLTPDNPKILKLKAETRYQRHVEDVKAGTQRAVDFLEAGDPRSAKEEFERIFALIPDGSVQRTSDQ